MALNLFRNSVSKTVDSLAKHLDILSTDDKDKKEKAIKKLSDDINSVHFILYGDSDTDPNPDQIKKLVPKLLGQDNDYDVFCKLAQYMHLFEFEAKKQTAGIMNYIIRRCAKNKADKYIKEKTIKKNGHNTIIDCLLRGYHDQHLAQNVGSVLQEMAKRLELAPMLLNQIRITRKKLPNDQPNDPSNTNTNTTTATTTTDQKDNQTNNTTNQPNTTNIFEERDIVDELFVLVRKPSFDIASDAYKTLQLLLTRNKKLIPSYLDRNYTKFFLSFNKLIQSDNYVTQRQFLNLLSELLLEKTNFNIMIRYISEKENLRIAMTLLKNSSNAISHEAFHIFKVFVANPKKARDIHIVLWKNKDKLISFLDNFLSDKAKEDEAFAEEKKIVIKHLKDLAIPEEIEKHRKRKQSRAKSLAAAKLQQQQQQLATDNANNDDNTGNTGNIKKSKSVGNVIPPTTTTQVTQPVPVQTTNDNDNNNDPPQTQSNNDNNNDLNNVTGNDNKTDNK